MRVVLVACVLFGALLAGCVGEGDLDPGNGNNLGEFDGETGAMSGRVFDANLNPLRNARVALVVDDQLVAEGRADDSGSYSISRIPPGSYRAQVSALLHHEDVAMVDIVAGQRIERDFMLEPMGNLELRLPFDVGPYDWSGVIECMFGEVNICQNNVVRHSQTVEPGVKTITVGLDWTANALFGAQEFTLTVASRVGGTNTILEATGTPPFEIVLDDSVIEQESLKFKNYEAESWTVQFEVTPVELEFVYQQPFTIWWTFHHWEPAPAGYSTLPDN